MSTSTSNTEQPAPAALTILSNSQINPQSQSPLFSKIPNETRDLIYEYVLTSYSDPKNPYTARQRCVRPGATGPPRIATELLLTCRAVYVEAYKLPFILNPVTLYDGDSQDLPPGQTGRRPSLRKLLPWQFAAVEALDMSMQQVFLEDNTLKEHARNFRAEDRHQGVLLEQNPYSTELYRLAPNKIRARNRRGQWNRLARFSAADGDNEEQQGQTQSAAGEKLIARLSLQDPTAARRITKLTIRLGRTDWWTWTSPPTDTTDRLSLDPGLAPSTFAKMQSFAEARRTKSSVTKYDEARWGAQIALFPSLKKLTFVLESFSWKKAQLDAVVECAKTWTFPMPDEGQSALVFDPSDKEAMQSYTWDGVDGYGYEHRVDSWLYGTRPLSTHRQGDPVPRDEGGEMARRFEVRVVEFVRRRIQ